jgi:chorismate synthase
MNISVFGESHGPAVGVLIEGLPPGLRLDFGRIEKEMRRRARGRDDLSTPRAESDAVEIISGVMDGVTRG